MRIAVIGAGGFVGRHLLPLLVEDAHEVTVLVHRRAESSAEGLADRIVGDVRDPGVVRSLLAGCDAVIHLAPGFAVSDSGAETITAGTETIVKIAAESGVRRLVHLSCLGADASSRSGFYVARWRAEQIVRSGEIPYTILRPSLILGRDDGITRPLAQLIRSLPVVPVPGTGQNRQQPIDVDDLARCISRSLLDETLKDQTVAVGGPMYVTLRQLIDLVGAQLGVSRPKALVPYRLLPILARFLPRDSRPLYLQPRLSQFQHGVVSSPGIVQRTFGFAPRSILSRLSDYLA